MHRIRAWLRWELSRRIEVTAGIKLIVLDRGVKAVLLIGGGIVLIVGERSGGLLDLTNRVHQELNLRPGNHLWLRLLNAVLQRFGTLSLRAQMLLAIAAILYGLLETVEAVGLLARRRWAEYLVLFATLAFIPLEIDELVRSPSVWKGLAFVINVAIAVYLIVRKRLFFGGPPAEAHKPVTQPAVPARR